MEWCIAQSSELLLSDASNWTPSEIEIIGNFLQPFIPYINHLRRDPFSLSYEEEEEDDDDDSEMTDQY
ncbi:uncharacterized protein OCT59_016846 [Rhizophagus irregularis]|uniref:Uncharacterized protein n=1 Tax=Rhizophagus irregularis (strain DAOM 197198w) TaxID=1432141 RepID=A0A015LAF1_RHIIW|nr:hypothetical protein RirG_031170 [Rhizophagus irregularis DAOM 197198w]UZO24550.1 hypothetical protein OCT59_016846 [Rhizophagus irregularis]